MATSTWQAKAAQTTDAEFRAWGKGISDAMTALGITKTSDTGQIDWSTVTFPATPLMKGSEIRQFTDALQSSNPIIFKITYGSSPTATTPAIWIQVAHSSDGAGNLTGPSTTPMFLSSASQDPVLRDNFASGDGGRFSLGCFVSAPSIKAVFGFYIERTKDSSGANTSEGNDIVTIGGSPSMTFQQYLPKVGSATPASPSTNYLCANPYTGYGTYNGNVGLYPIFPNQGFAGNPDLGGLVYFQADITTAGTTITVPIYGTSHTFITMGTKVYGSGNNGSTNIVSLAMRYE